MFLYSINCQSVLVPTTLRVIAVIVGWSVGISYNNMRHVVSRVTLFCMKICWHSIKIVIKTDTVRDNVTIKYHIYNRFLFFIHVPTYITPNNSNNYYV